MRTSIIYLSISVLAMASCSSPSSTATREDRLRGQDFSGDYIQEDRMGRLATARLMFFDDQKETFRTIAPSNMRTTFQPTVEAKIKALNPAYTTNILQMDVSALSNLLSIDVLNLNVGSPSPTGTTTGTTPTAPENAMATTFYRDRNIVLTGFNLTDDSIDAELLFIFGGADGAANPDLTTDNVSKNDVDPLEEFPYLAPPHKGMN